MDTSPCNYYFRCQRVASHPKLIFLQRHSDRFADELQNGRIQPDLFWKIQLLSKDPGLAFSAGSSLNPWAEKSRHFVWRISADPPKRHVWDRVTNAAFKRSAVLDCPPANPRPDIPKSQNKATPENLCLKPGHSRPLNS